MADMDANGGPEGPEEGLAGVVRGNDWRSLDVAALGDWRPTLRVTVVLPCYQGQEALDLTFAGLAAQTYPLDLLEVVVADDGSSPPIKVPPGAPFEARVVAQVHDGFGLARARNLGAAAATGEVLIFLDCDMVPEPGLVEAHARWHHAHDRALTLGFRRHVDFDGITPGELAAAGSVEAAVAGRASTAPQWIEFHMSRTNDLTSADDDLFRIVTGGNLGVRRGFFDEIGGFDGSFNQWGGEDTEMGYRAFNRGGLLVPERRALAWHQGEGASGPDPAEKRSQQEQAHRLAHLIAEKGFRKSLPGRSFEVPVVTVAIDASGRTYEDVADQVENVLASGFHDLVVGVSVPPDHPDVVHIERQYGPDPRVVISSDLMADVPDAAVRLEVPPRVRLWPTDVASLLRGLAGLGLVTVEAEEEGSGQVVRMVRTRALQRGINAGVADPWAAAGELFGEREMATDSVGLKVVKESKLRSAKPFRPVDNPPVLVLAGKVLRKLASVRSPRDLVVMGRWVVRGFQNVARRARLRLLRRRDARRAEIAGRTAVAVPGWVRVVGGGEHLPGAALWADAAKRNEGCEVVVAAPDAAADGLASVDVPVVRLGDDSGIPLAAPVNHLRFNPAGFLPVGSGAVVEDLPEMIWPEDRVRSARAALGIRVGRVDGAKAAARLLELTASGVPVLLDDARGAAAWLGSDLVVALGGIDEGDLADPTFREAVSVAQRRITLNTHSLPARLDQVRAAAGLPVQPVPSVSVVVSTNRPALVERIVGIVAAQDHPNTELILALHGDGFAAADPVAPPGLDLKVLRAPADAVFGHVLSQASALAEGEWVAKMDDDDWYGTEHLSDLVLAAGYSGADLVGKGSEFVYLEGAEVTLRRGLGAGEAPSRTISGGTLLVRAAMLREVCGWRGVPRGVDVALIDDVAQAGGAIWRTHPFGYLLRRTTGSHTWRIDDSYFLRQAEHQWPGLDMEVAGVEDAEEPDGS